MKLRNKKTGEHGNYKVISAGNLIRVRDLSSDESWQYDCIADFNDKWEDYKPTEPLIKDEKIRKAVRAWAEANSLTHVQFRSGELGDRFNGADFEYIYFNPWKADNLEDYYEYSIEELCGEEEECES